MQYNNMLELKYIQPRLKLARAGRNIGTLTYFNQVVYFQIDFQKHRKALHHNTFCYCYDNQTAQKCYWYPYF